MVKVGLNGSIGKITNFKENLEYNHVEKPIISQLLFNFHLIPNTKVEILTMRIYF